MLTVACVLKSGGLYTAEWVERLQAGVTRHLSVPHRFVCLSDVAVPCERIVLEHGWPGWWSKMELFRVPWSGPVLYLDLDCVVVGSLDEIAGHPHGFTMAHEYYRPAQLCSTAMAWTGDWSGLYRSFALDAAANMVRYDSSQSRRQGKVGDQAFIEDWMRAHGQRVETFRDLFGERSIASYKVHKCEQGPPAGAAVVAFHGQPKPNAFSTGWVKEQWAVS